LPAWQFFLIYCCDSDIVSSEPITFREFCLKFFWLFKVLCAAALLTACLEAACQQVAPQAPGLTKDARPFSPALLLNDMLYLSGHLGVDQATGKPSDNASQEAQQVLRSVRQSLEEAGMTMDDLVYVEVYCTDLSLYSVFNKEYVSFFRKPYPARDFIGVKDLLFGARFEVMGMAVRHAAEDKKQPTSAVWTKTDQDRRQEKVP
jgi:2-iminobutanoate/2-iminopropanoate deaminase